MENHTRKFHVAVLGLLVAGCATTQTRETRSIRNLGESIVMGNEQDAILQSGLNFSASANNVTFAYIRKEGNKYSYVVNGRPGPGFDDLSNIHISTTGGHFAYAGKKGERWTVAYDNRPQTQNYELVTQPILSTDGSHFAFFGQVGDKLVANLDGVEGPLFDDILSNAAVFSPDGKRFAYAGKIDDDLVVVVDGVKQPPFKAVNHLTFSDNGRGFGYIGGLTNGYQVVVNGVEGPVRNDVGTVLRLSPNGERWAYPYKKKGTWYVHESGEDFGPYEKVGDEFGYYSPDSKSFAFVAFNDNEWFVVHNGVEQRHYQRTDLPKKCFNDDGSVLFYLAQVESHYVPVVNHTEGQAFDWVIVGRSFVGANNRPVVCGGRKGRMSVDVIGASSLPWDDVGADNKSNDWISFSPSGRRWAYIGKQGSNWHPVVDGVIGQPVRRPFSLAQFSPNDRHYCFTVKNRDAYALVIDGVQGANFSEVPLGGVTIDNDGECSVWVMNTKTSSLDRRAEKRLPDTNRPVPAGSSAGPTSRLR